ncbi:HERV-H LTR-associating protein 1 [Epinephelus fuscoguttatus]|uniref:HERV-H LTR-associating protein 1 n=1 Tax=Epinephelus fuscoguttatus TaxID=293821 RepID=UPI0020D16308|nr:HERV-H LTR-associating protein 1 [Epinephelus fuscoguttatus]
MAALQHPRLCFIICVSTISLLILFSQVLTDRRQEGRHKRDVLDSTDIPAEHIDPAAIDLTPLVNTLINTSQSGSRQLFSLLSVTSYSSLALHKLTLLVYNISNIRSLESNKFRRRFCYCVTNETNDLTDFTAILLDVMGNSTSYLHELFKSASILSVSQRNNSDCIYICVMAGKMGREMPELWEVGSITPLFNQTIMEGPHRGNVSSFRLPVEWHQLPTNLSHISPSGMSSSLTSRVHSTAHVSPTTMDQTAVLTAKITTAQPLATAPQPVTTIPQSQTTVDGPETTMRERAQEVTVQEVTTRAVMTAQTTATKVPTILQPVTSTQPETTLQVTTASVTTALAPTTVRAPPTTVRAPPTTARAPSTPSRAPSTPARAPSTTVRSPPTTARAPSTPSRAPSTPARAPSTTVRSPPTLARAPSTTARAPSTTVRTPSTTARAPPTTVTSPSIPVTARLTTVRAPSTTVTARSTMVTAQTTPVTAPSITTLTTSSTKLTTFLPVISLTRLTTSTHQPSMMTQHATLTGHTTRLSPVHPTAGFTVSRRTTGLLSRITTTPSTSLETEKPGCPWRRPELTDLSLSGSTTTVSAHKLQPCVLELCKFFSQCLCRPFSHKTRMKRYCDDSHLWYEKHTSEVCRRVRRVSFSRNLKQRCLTKMCNKL